MIQGVNDQTADGVVESNKSSTAFLMESLQAIQKLQTKSQEEIKKIFTKQAEQKRNAIEGTTALLY